MSQDYYAVDCGNVKCNNRRISWLPQLPEIWAQLFGQKGESDSTALHDRVRSGDVETCHELQLEARRHWRKIVLASGSSAAKQVYLHTLVKQAHDPTSPCNLNMLCPCLMLLQSLDEQRQKQAQAQTGE
jgi:hypothetical protein